MPQYKSDMIHNSGILSVWVCTCLYIYNITDNCDEEIVTKASSFVCFFYEYQVLFVFFYEYQALK